MSVPPLHSLPPRAGIGLRSRHYADVLDAAERGAAPAWAEPVPQGGARLSFRLEAALTTAAEADAAHGATAAAAP